MDWAFLLSRTSPSRVAWEGMDSGARTNYPSAQPGECRHWETWHGHESLGSSAVSGTVVMRASGLEAWASIQALGGAWAPGQIQNLN